MSSKLESCRMPSQTVGARTSSSLVLLEVTKEKIAQLQLRKNCLSDHFKPVLAAAAATIDDLGKIRILYDGLKNIPVPQDLDTDLKAARLFVETAGSNPSTSPQLLSHWMAKLRQEIQHILNKCEYSFVFGKLLTQWLDSAGANSDEMADEEFVRLDSASAEQTNKEREETVKRLEETVFTPSDVDCIALREFLNTRLFDKNNVETRELLERVRTEMKDFSQRLMSETISSDDVRTCISGLSTQQNCLADDVKNTLEQVRANEVVVTELASLLTSRLRGFKTWAWPGNGVLLQVRRAIAGKYRAFLDLDIPTALFLHYVGVRWASHFRGVLVTVYQSKLWKCSKNWGKSIDRRRHKTHAKLAFGVLPRSMQQQKFTGYNADGTEDRTQPNPLRPSAILHVIATEARLHEVLYPSQPFTVVRTDLEWFGPSLSHDAIRVLMEFFGVPNDWLTFFTTFLEVPVYFEPSQPTRVRKRGTPFGYVLSHMFGEVILFLMDLHVNQTSEVWLYRIHDDIWFWDKNEDTVVKAWEAMGAYAALMKLTFNEEKSGSSSIRRPEASGETSAELSGETSPGARFGRPPLPQATVRWGFLSLQSDGVFRIEAEAESLERYVREMVGMLDKAKSVLSWVHVYNRYLAFFVRNFGEVAVVFGLQHVEQIQSALQLVHKKAFTRFHGNVLEELKHRFPSVLEFNDTPMLDMWAYMSVTVGGLGFRHILTDVIGLKTAMMQALNIPQDSEQGQRYTEKYFSELPEKDRTVWEQREKEKEEKRKVLLHGVEASPDSDPDSDSDPRSAVPPPRALHVLRPVRLRRERTARWHPPPR
mmetsp:Transcript_16578/g.28743  ORF Transcript_16578/g.28743 Transcript_16578/m.28743 type:complete len:819 (-) Transcript_16578:463-2919(-)